MKRIVSCVLVFFLVLSLLPVMPTEVLAATTGPYTYTVSNEKATLTQYNGTGGNITIPSTLGGYPVIGIGDSAFMHCDSLTSITIPEGITSIGENAFFGCSKLTSITIPNGITKIGMQAFVDCSSLDNVVLPDSLTVIDYGLFNGCTNLKTITMGSGITRVGEMAFYNCRLKSVIIKDLATWLNTNVNDWYGIPSATQLFLNNKCLTQVVIPEDVTEIKDYTLKYNSITSIVLPEGVTTIGENVFTSNIKHVWYEGSERPWSSCDRYLLEATWHYNTCPNDTHVYTSNSGQCINCEWVRCNEGFHLFDNCCDANCNDCEYVRTPPHAYDNANDLTCNVCKESLTPAAPALAANEPDTITLEEIDGVEYSMDGINWQKSHIFSGLSHLTAYTFYQRVAESETSFVSESSLGLTVTTRDKYTPSTPEDFTFLEITESSVTLNAVPGCEYSMDGVTWQSSPTFSGLSANTLYIFYQRVAENSKLYASECAILHITTLSKMGTITYDPNGGINAPENTTGTVSTHQPTRSSYQFVGWAFAPDAYAVYKPGDRYSQEEDIVLYAAWKKLCDSCAGAGYGVTSCSSCSGKGIKWSSCSSCGGSGKVTGKTKCFGCNGSGVIINSNNSARKCVVCGGSGTISSSVSCSGCSGAGGFITECRSCGGSGRRTYDCGRCIDGVPEFTPEAPEMPELQIATVSSVVLAYISTCEYSMDGVNWQDSNVFQNLDANTQYSFYQRYKATKYSYSSDMSLALTVMTEKERPAPPSAPVLESKQHNQVVLVAVNGCEYSMDGINWQVDNTFTGLLPATNYTFYCRLTETDVFSASYASNGLTVKTNNAEYIVVFKNWDDSIISTNTYYYGDTVIIPANPTKAADNTYTYTFAGWDNPVVACTDNATYIATYTSVYIDYTVEFKNWDGSVVSTKTYHWGEPINVSADPTKPADNTYAYTFAGWDKEVVNCAGDATYTATYNSTYINYTVEFRDWNGVVLSAKTYHYGDTITAPANPTKAADNTYTYTFAGWDKTVVNCEGDATYTATYTPAYIDYTVTFKNWDGSILDSDKYHYNDTVTPPSTTPTKPEDNTYKYVFKGWDSEIVKVVSNKIYTAVYEAIKKIVEITSNVFHVQGNSIEKVGVGTSTSSFVSKLDQAENVKVYKGNTQISGNTAIGTGMEVKLLDGNAVVKNYTVVVTGDTNGDGAISVTDMIAIKAHVLKKTLLTGAYADAADTSNDNAISITDFIQVKAHILGKSSIVPN